jgi:deoxyribonuclease-4
MSAKIDALKIDGPVLPLIGGHLSAAGGWSQIPGRAVAAGAEVVQVFSSNPRIWPSMTPDMHALTELRAMLRELRVPLFMHAVYLVNPASPDQDLRARSAAALAHALLTGAAAGAASVVTHLGSHRGEGFDRAAPLVAETLTQAWQEAAARGPAHAVGAAGGPAEQACLELPTLLLETSAGSGATVGGTLGELQTLLDLLPPPGAGAGPPASGGAPAPAADCGPQFGLCLDTAHMFAAGYAVHEEAGLAELVTELEQRDLLRRVSLMHLNDSASLLASKSDRHANPGEGALGYLGLARVVRHPAFLQIPFVLEVPGADGHGPGPAEITLVKRMRQGAPSPRAHTGGGESGPGGPR